MSKPIVAIVGRPNVGKSTLFNRIVGGRVAIVEERPGVTRDRLYQDADWSGRTFTVVDTGGLDFKEEGEIISGVRQQAELAIRESDVVLFVVDARAGLTAMDQDVAAVLRRAERPVILVANKVEDFTRVNDYYEFFQVGLGDPVPISAIEGRNTGDLLDQMVALLPSPEEFDESGDVLRIAVIGRPNVGKSSLINSLLGEERVIVSSIPGTTRDAIDTLIELNDNRYMLVDTAGMRRRSRIDDNTERYSVIRSLRAVDRCDVAVTVLDATQGVTEQDKRIAGYAHDNGKASLLVINKWDLVEKDGRTMNRFTETIREELVFMRYAPLLFTSALTGQRVNRVLELVNNVAEQHSMRISTGNLNSLIREAVLHNPPPGFKGRRLKVYYATQGGVKPPTFILFVNDKGLVHFSYPRYLENQIRQTYGFEGTPMRLIFREREERDD